LIQKIFETVCSKHIKEENQIMKHKNCMLFFNTGPMAGPYTTLKNYWSQMEFGELSVTWRFHAINSTFS